ncbi:MAG: hypothetical protein ACXWP5_04060 [Bdellovibrionota bacterium]
MRWGIPYLLAAMLLSAPPGEVRADELLRQAADQVRSTDSRDLDLVLTPQSSCPSGPIIADGAIDGVLGKPIENFAKFASSVSCRDLFSPEPPAVLRSAVNSKGVPISFWTPICSMVYLGRSRERLPNLSLEMNLQDAEEKLRDRDRCGVPPKPRSQVQRRVREMTAAEKKEFVAEIYKYKNEEEARCCAPGETECQDFFKHILITICQPEKDPTKPDPCLLGGVYFSTQDEGAAEVRYLRQHPSPFPGQKNFPRSAGLIQVTSFENSNGRPDSSSRDLAHEFGHACSQIRREIAIRNGDEAAFVEMRNQLHYFGRDGNAGAGCAVTSAETQTFQELLGRRGVSPAAIDCTIEVARNQENQRFLSAPCASGCPHLALEEGAAEIGSIYYMHQDHVIPDLIPTACYTLRDKEHPWEGDILACALKDQLFQSSLRGVLRCR